MQDEVQTAGRPLRWSDPEAGLFVLVVVLVALSSSLWQSLSYGSLEAVGFYRWFYGPDRLALARDRTPRETAYVAVMTAGGLTQPAGQPWCALGAVAAAEPTARARESAHRLALSRLLLWAYPLTVALQVAAVFAFRLLGDPRPAEPRLSPRRFRRYLLAGLLAALVVTPGVTALHVLVKELYRSWQLSGVEEHPFTLLGQEPLHPLEWGMLILCATVAAPVWEELLFRGVLQPWFAARRAGGHLAMAAALGLALLWRSDGIRAAVSAGPLPLLQELVPALFVVALVPVYLLVCRRSRSPAGPALFGTAVLFAALHSRVWPSPVPLVPLGLALGYLAHRTQSLVAPITLHALFNGAACVLLLWEVLRR